MPASRTRASRASAWCSAAGPTSLRSKRSPAMTRACAPRSIASSQTRANASRSAARTCARTRASRLAQGASRWQSAVWTIRSMGVAD